MASEELCKLADVPPNQTLCRCSVLTQGRWPACRCKPAFGGIFAFGRRCLWSHSCPCTQPDACRDVKFVRLMWLVPEVTVLSALSLYTAFEAWLATKTTTVHDFDFELKVSAAAAHAGRPPQVTSAAISRSLLVANWRTNASSASSIDASKKRFAAASTGH